MKRFCSVAIICLFLSHAVAPAVAQLNPAASSNGDQEEIKNFRLNMARLEQYTAASKALAAYAKENPSVQESSQNGQDAKTISDVVKRVEKYPGAVAAIQTAGLSPREFAVMGLTLFTVGMMVALKKQGNIKAIPATVLPENVAFFEQNYDKIESVVKAMQAAQ